MLVGKMLVIVTAVGCDGFILSKASGQDDLYSFGDVPFSFWRLLVDKSFGHANY
jgi:hypothetical protein